MNNEYRNAIIERELEELVGGADSCFYKDSPDSTVFHRCLSCDECPTDTTS